MGSGRSAWSRAGIRNVRNEDPHHGGGALDDLPGLALLVDLTEAGPLAQLHVGVHLGNKELN